MERYNPGNRIGYRILEEGRRIRYYETARSRFLAEVKEKIATFTVEEHTALAGDLFRMALTREGVKQRAALTVLNIHLGGVSEEGFYDLGKLNRRKLAQTVFIGLEEYATSTVRKPQRKHTVEKAVSYVTPYIPRDTATHAQFQEACTNAGITDPTANQTPNERAVFDRLEHIVSLVYEYPNLGMHVLASILSIPQTAIEFYIQRLAAENLIAPDRIQRDTMMEIFGRQPDGGQTIAIFSRDELLQQFLEVLILNNYNAQQAANAFGISRREGFSLLQQLRLSGEVTIPDRQHPTGLQRATERKIEAFLEYLIRHKFSVEGAAKEFGISPTTARYYVIKLKELGHITDSEAPAYKIVLDRSEHRAREFLTFLQKHNFSVRPAARAFGISFSRAYEYIELLRQKNLLPPKNSSEDPPRR